MGIDSYARNQVIMNNLKYSLKDLYEEKSELLSKLAKTKKCIDKHETLLKKLEEEDEL